jgi:uncharacterized membrane protein
MKTITLNIADNVYKELKKSIGVRMLTGSSYGINDAFIKKIVNSIENGDTNIDIKYKEKDEEVTNKI